MTLDPSPFQERVTFMVTLPAIAATGTYAIATPHPSRIYKIDRVELIEDATYTSDAANYYVLTLEHGSGSVAAASWSTLTGADGTITAGVPVKMNNNAAAANLVVPGGDVLSLLATKHASAANITPRVVVHGHFVT